MRIAAWEEFETRAKELVTSNASKVRERRQSQAAGPSHLCAQTRSVLKHVPKDGLTELRVTDDVKVRGSGRATLCRHSLWCAVLPVPRGVCRGPRASHLVRLVGH
jgi:hypothetical protein